MKKCFLIPILLLIICFGGCCDTSNNYEPYGDVLMNNIYVTEIERCGIEWEQIQFHVDLTEILLETETKSIETKQHAIDVATSIIEKCHKQGRFLDYVLISVIHSTEDNVWRYEYSNDQRNVDVEDLIECGSLYVAIDGNSGALIEAWIEE